MRRAIEKMRANACHVRLLVGLDLSAKQVMSSTFSPAPALILLYYHVYGHITLDSTPPQQDEFDFLLAETARLQKMLAAPGNQNAKMDALKRMSRIMQDWLAGSLRGYILNWKAHRVDFLQTQAQFARIQATGSQGERR